MPVSPSSPASCERAAHPLGELAADRQAEAEARLRAGAAPALEALEDLLALRRMHARAAVGDLDVRLGGVAADRHADGLAHRGVAQRVVEQDADDAGDGVRVAAAPARARRRDDVELDVALFGAQPELGRDRARELAELDRLRAQRHRRVEPAEVQQLAREAGEPQQLAAGARDLGLGVGDVQAVVREVLLEQLHRALQHRQRRAQLVRGGRHEGPPRLLLPSQLLLHAPERAREVADLVASLVVLERGVGDALLRDPHGRRAQPPEPAQQRARQRDGERHRHQQADRARGQQCVAHLVDRGRDLGQAPLDDEHADDAALVAEQPHPDPDHVALDVGRRRARALGVQRGQHGAADRGARARVVEHVAREHRVEDQHAAVGALAQLLGHPLERELVLARLAQRVLDGRPGGQHGRAQVRRALLAQPVGERAQQHRGGDPQRDRAREQEGQQQAGPQASRQPPPHPQRSLTR